MFSSSSVRFCAKIFSKSAFFEVIRSIDFFRTTAREAYKLSSDKHVLLIVQTGKL